MPMKITFRSSVEFELTEESSLGCEGSGVGSGYGDGSGSGIGSGEDEDSG